MSGSLSVIHCRWSRLNIDLGWYIYIYQSSPWWWGLRFLKFSKPQILFTISFTFVGSQVDQHLAPKTPVEQQHWQHTIISGGRGAWPPATLLILLQRPAAWPAGTASSGGQATQPQTTDQPMERPAGGWTTPVWMGPRWAGCALCVVYIDLRRNRGDIPDLHFIH